MRILIVTDAWPPQVNGVVRTIQTVGRELGRRGHDVRYITPEGHRTWAIPSYPEISLSLVGASAIGREIDAIKPDAIHIATEGPLGWAARRACLRRGLPFTTSFHTRFAEYIETRFPHARNWTAHVEPAAPLSPAKPRRDDADGDDCKRA